MKMFVAAFAALMCTSAFANHDEAPPPAPTPVPIAVAGAAAVSGSRSTSTSDATGGAANATGGAASANTGASTSGASSDNAVTMNYERSAPSLAQGGLYIGECGAGANGGGSGSGGAGFLGATWTPRECKMLLAAKAFAAIGMPDEACRIITGLKSVKDRYKELNIDPPTCILHKPEVAKVDPIDTSQFLTKEDVKGFATKEEMGKAFRASVSK